MRFTAAHKNDAKKPYRQYKKTYYEILGVAETATVSEIKKTYYRLSKIYQPDKTQEEKKRQFSPQIANAYEVLADLTAIQAYDQKLLQSADPTNTGYKK